MTTTPATTTARAGAAVRRAPVTATLVATLWPVGAATGSLQAGPPRPFAR
jgi:hypothetical protein